MESPILFPPAESPYLVPFDGTFRVSDAATKPKKKLGKKAAKEQLKGIIEDLRSLQRTLYADNRYAVLLVFQAMDAAGKDGTIRAVMTGINPAGCQVFSFKQPSDEELDHDFLWRIYRRLPEQGRIGIFNRSHYEDVLVVRVHPGYMSRDNLPRELSLSQRWSERFESIQSFEQHLARNGTVVLKFWLNVSRDEQRKRLLDRIDEPESNWKFSAADLDERERWDDYMQAYQEALNATSKPWAPWYAIPADSKPYMRLQVAQIIVETLRKLDIQYPQVSKHDREQMRDLRKLLVAQGE